MFKTTNSSALRDSTSISFNSSSVCGSNEYKISNECKESNQLDHNNLPDVSQQMFTYLLKRVAILEHALKEKDGIDVSKEDKELEEIYANFITAMQEE